MSYNLDAEVVEFGKSRRLLSHIAPQARGVLGNNRDKLPLPCRVEHRLIAGALRCAATDGAIVKTGDDRKAVTRGDLLGYTKLILDRRLRLLVS